MKRWIAVVTALLLLGLGSCVTKKDGGCGATDPCPVGSVQVSPGSATIIAGSTTSFSAVVKDTRGETMSGSVSWSTGSPAVATVSSSGVVTGVAVGTATISATSGGKSGSATVTVTPNGAPSVTITSPQDGASVVEGTDVALSGSATDPEDGALTGAALQWASSSDGALGSGASVSRADLSVGPHTITLTATDAFGQSGSASVTLTVTSLPQGDAYEPDDDPANATPLEYGEPQTHDLVPATDEDWLRLRLTEASALAVETRGASESDDTFLEIYDSSMQLLATADDKGGLDRGSLYTTTECLAPGDYFVRVTSYDNAMSFEDYQVGFVSLGCADAVEKPGYQIDVRFLPGSAPDASLAAAVAAATERWSDIITTDLPAGLSFKVFPSTCINETVPPYMVFIDDLVVLARIDSLDDAAGTLAHAGYCRYRTDSGLPAFGLMEIDVADVATISADPTVVIHELGHALGIGTAWPAFGLLAEPSDTAYGGTLGADTHFTGASAIVAFDAVGGAGYADGAKVPVENDYTVFETGSLDSHWRQSVLTAELMDPWYYPGGPAANPLSVVTIGSLEDLGYTVNYAAADAYTLSLDVRFDLAAGARSLGDDVLRGPTFAVPRFVAPGFVPRADDGTMPPAPKVP